MNEGEQSQQQKYLRVFDKREKKYKFLFSHTNKIFTDLMMFYRLRYSSETPIWKSKKPASVM